MAKQQMGDNGDAECSDRTVDGIGGSGAETGQETHQAPICQCPANAEHTDGADGGGNGESDEPPPDEYVWIHCSAPFVANAQKTRQTLEDLAGCLAVKRQARLSRS